MTRAEFNKWISALRSGDYKQNKKGLLRTKGNEFCCLGVYLDAVKKVKWEKTEGGYYMYMNEAEYLPARFVDDSFYSVAGASTPRSGLSGLATLNDADGITFKVIADMLEVAPEQYVIIQDEANS